MKLKTVLSGIVLAVFVAGSAAAASYPLKKPREVNWSFAGLFGTWDKAQLQRGFQVHREVCSACHGLEYIAFRNLEALGYSDDEVKAFAAEFFVMDGPNEEGEMFEREARPSDRWPSPFPNAKAAAFANNGAVPPDLSLIAKARAPKRGFPTFVFDIFTMYSENGPDYLYSLLTGYQEPPEGVEVAEGNYYNPYFANGKALAMAPPIDDGFVSYADGTPETLDQYARDVSAFLMWTAEPHLVERKSLGFRVLVFLAVFAMLLYLVKKQVWSRMKEQEA